MLLFIMMQKSYFLSKETAKQDVNEAMINGCNQSCHRSIAVFHMKVDCLLHRVTLSHGHVAKFH